MKLEVPVDFKKLKASFLETMTISKYSIIMYFRERTAVFFSLFIPVMLMGVFGLLNLGGGVKFNVAIVDEANNQYSKQVIQVVEKVTAFKVVTEDKATALDQLEKSKQSYVVVLPKDFGANFGQSAGAAINKVPSSGAKVAVVQPQKINIYYDMSQNAANIQVGFTVFDKIFDGMTHQIARVPQYFEINQISIGGKDLRYIDYVVPGLVAMSVMQLSIFAVTAIMISWKERGILKRLLATPIHPSVIIFSQVSSRLLITIMQAGLLILLGVILFQLHVVGSVPLVLLLIVLGGLIFLCLGFALSGVAKSQNSVAAIAQVFVFPQMFLSGIFFPREAFPEWLYKISNFFPLTFFAEALRNVMVKGYSIFQIRYDLLGMTVWAIIMFVAAVKLFRWE
jgi:ABC-2 type transport system permease protein